LKEKGGEKRKEKGSPSSDPKRGKGRKISHRGFSLPGGKEKKRGVWKKKKRGG